ncbi:2OG-Fe dioxygenase family protein [Massilia solisilvae]|uniref:2OG-Fe dioxygenase family protein n=1 Tax=Massilia solisilvae TaxID=1811225 RepID=A0ABT2BFY6_9BURK|nr:2OG-Fe dioxygenase family protein [Massilia solisilvae]MCS0606828.1 2OG-Fe dioxygenase family protein [Massilia solisilvae]
MSTSAQPFTPLPRIAEALRTQGYALVRPEDVAALAGCTVDELDALAPSWNRLAPDKYLRDGGHYRQRRHSCFIERQGVLEQAPHRAHWQPVEYNALHGGMHRLFEPVEPATVAHSAWQRLLRALGEVCSSVKGRQPWFIEAHQFRIDTAEGIGRPTPEGAHRDGVDFVAVILVERHNVKGGETRVFEANGPDGKRFTMLEPWTMLLLDDEAVIHESTPIQPTGDNGHRDTLVLTYRAGAFQGDDA